MLRAATVGVKWICTGLNTGLSRTEFDIPVGTANGNRRLLTVQSVDEIEQLLKLSSNRDRQHAAPHTDFDLVPGFKIT